jgi:hypothetical protein
MTEVVSFLQILGSLIGMIPQRYPTEDCVTFDVLSLNVLPKGVRVGRLGIDSEDDAPMQLSMILACKDAAVGR